MQKKHKKRLGIECLSCGWVGISRHRHDFRMCLCENQAFVDGGTDYLRRGAKKMDMIRIVTIADAKEAFAELGKKPAAYFYGAADDHYGNIYSTQEDLRIGEDMAFVNEILKLKVVKRISVKKVKAA